MILVPKNWAKHQHYKDRLPPWIKLHRDLLTDRDFMTLPTASKALAPLMWLLASESKDGRFTATLEELQFRLHISKQDYDEGIKPLINKGFFIVASTMLADCKQVAIPETETETEIETEIDAYASLSETAFPPCPHEKIISLFAKHLGNLTQPRVWEGNRAAMLRQRWIQASKPSEFSPEGYKTEEDGLKWWDSFFAYIANDTKLARGFETNGRVWQPDLPWIVTSANFAKIIDGKYEK